MRDQQEFRGRVDVALVAEGAKRVTRDVLKVGVVEMCYRLRANLNLPWLQVFIFGMMGSESR